MFDFFFAKYLSMLVIGRETRLNQSFASFPSACLAATVP